MQRAAAQGIGWALTEGYFIGADGAMLNNTFLDYRVPTAVDLPSIETVIAEVHNPRHPFGFRGAGENAIAPPLAVISNAIHDAPGIRLRDMAITPALVLKTLADKMS